MPDAATVSVLLRADDQLSAKLQGAQNKIRDFGRSAGEAGRGLLALSAPLVAIGGLSLKAFIDFESSFTGVRKTVDATEEQFKELAAGFRSMAKEIPINVNELNRIGMAAGQLGIKTENILSFTRTIAAMGVSTELSADQAATSLARLANITGLPQEQMDRLGSAIVDLGNNLATTEPEIVDFGLRIAGAGKIAGLTEAQILAIGGAMSSVGVQAEAGGTAVQKVLLAMTEQVATSGEQLEIFAATAGMTAEQFSKAFKTDAGGAFTAFVEGLGLAGTDAFAILEKLGLEDQRLMRSFLSLAGAGDKLRYSMDLSTIAFAENTALTEEARKRYATAESQVTFLKNSLQDMAITIGEALIPPLLNLVKAVRPIIEGLGEWIERHPKLTTILIAGAAAVAGLGTALIALGLIIPGIVTGISLLTGAFAALSGALLVLAANPIILAVAGLTALGVVAYLGWQRLQYLKSEMDEMADTVERGGRKVEYVTMDMARGWQLSTDVMDTAQIAADSLVIHGLDPVADAAREAEKAGESLKLSLKGLSDQANDTSASIAANTKALEGLVAGFVKEAEARVDIYLAAQKLGVTLDQVLEQMADLRRAGLSAAVAEQVVYTVLKGKVDEFLVGLAAAKVGGEEMFAALRAAGIGLIDTFDILLALTNKLTTEEKIVAVKDALTKLGVSFGEVSDAIAEHIAGGLGPLVAWQAELALRTADANKRLDELALTVKNGPALLAAMRNAGVSVVDMFKRLAVQADSATASIEAFLRATEELAGLARREISIIEIIQYAKAKGISYRAAAQAFWAAGYGVPFPTLSPEEQKRLPVPYQLGGLVTRPTLALVGERGPEAIVPLGRGMGTASSLTINTTINGPVFGERDLEDKIAQIWRDVARAGGFRGLI